MGRSPFTPYLVDHSAFDAYALLIEAAGRRLFYSGDIRAHGRKGKTFERLLDNPPEVDVLLLEGTTLSRDGSDLGCLSESEVEKTACEVFKATEGMILACYSAQNIDRYVSLYRATLQADRDLVVDLYTAAIARATGLETIPQAGWDRVKVFVPLSQRMKVLESEEFERVRAVAESRIYPEDLNDQTSRLVMTFRSSMVRDLERAACLEGAAAIWSMWPGYLDQPGSRTLKAFLEANQIPLSVIHASGHAKGKDLQRLARAFKTERIVPIHTAKPELYGEVFGVG